MTPASNQAFLILQSAVTDALTRLQASDTTLTCALLLTCKTTHPRCGCAPCMTRPGKPPPHCVQDAVTATSPRTTRVCRYSEHSGAAVKRCLAWQAQPQQWCKRTSTGRRQQSHALNSGAECTRGVTVRQFARRRAARLAMLHTTTLTRHACTRATNKRDYSAKVSGGGRTSGCSSAMRPHTCACGSQQWSARATRQHAARSGSRGHPSMNYCSQRAQRCPLIQPTLCTTS